MSFTSYDFIIFLAVVFLLYYTLLKKTQWPLLLLASWVFYAFSGWHNLLYIGAVTVITYFCGRMMSRREGKKNRRPWLIACLVLDIGILAVIKYAEFAVGIFASPEDAAFFRFAVPLGLSFFTFQSLGYAIDAYRAKKSDAFEPNFFKFALFVSFFPQLIQGPISRFGDLQKQLVSPHAADAENISAGITRVIFGFFKKLVVADALIPVVRTLSGDGYGGFYVFVTVLIYAVTLYADFTGGIDITIGAARIFGIKLAENFDGPFFSKSIAEYWRRWHITMGTWFRDYIFYPLSVSRPLLGTIKPAKRLLGKKFGRRVPVYIATLVTWFATGLWHGAAWNFVVWGLLNGLVILISQEFLPLYKKFHAKHVWSNTRVYNAFQILRTFWLMGFIRALDVYADVPRTFSMYLHAFSPAPLKSFGLTFFTCGVVIAAIGVMILARYWKPKTVTSRIAVCAGLFAAIVIFGTYGFGYNLNQFIYTKF